MRFIKKYSINKLDILAIDTTPSPHNSFIYSYLVSKQESRNDCLVIDPGPASSFLFLSRVLQKEKCSHIHVFLSHIHIDHAGSTALLAKFFYDKTKVYLHPKGLPHLINPEKLWLSSLEVLKELAITYGKPDGLPEEIVISTNDDELLQIGELEIRILHTPGHSPHHQSILIENELLFPGESLGMFFEEWGATLLASPPPFKYEIYLDSMKKQMNYSPKLLALPHNTIISTSSYLNNHIEQIELWRKTANETDNLNDFINTLLERDKNLKRLWKTNNSIIKDTILTNLFGAFQAFRKS